MNKNGEPTVYDEYKKIKEVSREKRADNREQSTQFLDERGIKYSEHNHGAHLVVEAKDQTIDFWPGTGRFIGRDDNKCDGRGVRNLIKFCDVIGIIRPEVMRFAKAMEAMLRKNDHKGGWGDIDKRELMDHVDRKMNNLFEVLQEENDVSTMEECADVANYVMMIFDNCGE